MAKGWLRFSHLQKRNLVQSWTQLERLQKLYGFPKGRMVSPNIRVWTEEEIDEYIASCPVEGPPPRGAAKQKHERRLKADTAPARQETPLVKRPQPRGAAKTPRGPPRKADSTNADSPTTA
jgi:hypothetical protein